MVEKIATIDQLKKLALRTKTDSAARIAELAELIATGLGDVQHAGIIITLPVASWSGRAQTVHNEFFLANDIYWYFVCGDADCFMECSDAGVKADNITVDGQATFRCEITPENDLTVNILRLEVET